MMTTLIIKRDTTQSRQFLAFARTLSFVDIVEKNDTSAKKFKPAVERSLKKSVRGKDLVECTDAEDMFRQWGLR